MTQPTHTREQLKEKLKTILEAFQVFGPWVIATDADSETKKFVLGRFDAGAMALHEIEQYITAPPATPDSDSADLDAIRIALNWIYCGSEDREGQQHKIDAFAAIDRLRAADLAKDKAIERLREALTDCVQVVANSVHLSWDTHNTATLKVIIKEAEKAIEAAEQRGRG